MLSRLGFDGAALDAKLLTGYGLGLDSLAMATRENETVDAAAATQIAKLLQRRMTGESVARIIGEREFYGLAFTLNAATLEPRPETELLVDLALDGLADGARLLDLGTGTGCIAISILANKASASAVAVDLSALAIEAARVNAIKHRVGERLELLQGSWFEPLFTSPSGGEADPLGSGEGAFSRRGGEKGPLTRPSADLSPEGRGEERFDVIVSNPPYITSAVVETLSPEVRDFDPRLALDGGPDGLAPYRIIAAEAGRWLHPRGRLLVEIGFDQGAAVADLLTAAGFAGVAVHKDLNGLDRVVSAHQI